MSDDLVTQLRTYFGSPLLPVSHQAADEIERLRAENARLREALEPFACAADDLDRENWGSGSIEGSLAYITAEDCRAARAALAEKGAGT